MQPSSLVRLAVLGEGLLVVIALVWQRWRGLPFAAGDITSGVSVGCVAAALLAGANFYLLCGAPDIGPVRSVRRFFVRALKPVFAGITPVQAAVISVAAGVGEELFFRGVLQQEVGLVAASAVFGLAHTGGRGTLVFGCWVAVMGVVLGLLAVWTGGLVAPVVAHAVYDAAALSYIRLDTDCAAVSLESSRPQPNGP